MTNERAHDDVRSAPAPDRRIAAALRDFAPAYFGMVMATGIVSIAAHGLGLPAIGQILFWLNVIVYSVLWALTALRVAWYPSRFFADMTDHLGGPGSLTVVAASSLLGGQFLLLQSADSIALAFWAAALVLWIALTYAVLAALTITAEKPTFDEGIGGGWLLIVVATQSIAVLSALLAARMTQPFRLELNFLALSMWLAGGALYGWMICLIFYRYTFFRFTAADLSPPYWINMGAMAISTLAGSVLIQNAPQAPFLVSLLPFLKGFTLLYWATGTWWIPLLLVLTLWRYLYKRFPIRYDALYWSAVFPLGMYSVSTHEMATAMTFDFLQPVAHAFMYIALLAWAAAFYGALRRISRLARRGKHD